MTTVEPTAMQTFMEGYGFIVGMIAAVTTIVSAVVLSFRGISTKCEKRDIQLNKRLDLLADDIYVATRSARAALRGVTSLGANGDALKADQDIEDHYMRPRARPREDDFTWPDRISIIGRNRKKASK